MKTNKNTQKSKTSSLKEKLKGALSDLSVDVFGYEKTISHNITSYIERIAVQLKIPSERLYIRIFQEDHIIRCFLYEQHRPINRIETKELAYIFLDNKLAVLVTIQNKVAFGVKQYLEEFASANRMDIQSVRIWIHIKDTQVQIKAFDQEQFIKLLTLNSLIKFVQK